MGIPARYGGKGVLQAVSHVNSSIATVVTGMDPTDQRGVDEALVELDGTPNKGNLGANAILGTSLAVAKAAAADAGQSLFRSLGGETATTLPVPMMNVINGGAHADNTIDLQEFMVVPVGADSFSEGLRVGVETFHALKALLHGRGLSTAVGDEGGFAPDLESTEQAIEAILEAADNAGHRDRIAIALDPASTELFADGSTRSRAVPSPATAWSSSTRSWSIATRSSRSRMGWPRTIGTAGGSLTERLGDRVQLVGDDLFVTNVERLQRGIDEGSANSILIKVNQIGSLSETLDAIAARPRRRL